MPGFLFTFYYLVFIRNKYLYVAKIIEVNKTISKKQA